MIASRCGSGSILERTYRMPGAAIDLIERGAVAAGRLAGHKARLRLLVGSAFGHDSSTLFPVR